MTIEEFIRARLDEDEQIARAAAERRGQWWTAVDPFSGDDPDRVEGSGSSAVAYDSAAEPARHIARHDPARVLRQAPVLRAVVELIEGMVSATKQIEAENAVLYPLAAIWDQHPDYLEEWKP
ncbi:hypothetical protein IU487_22305 [Nocardia puris]|uniref:DUF6221 family protein n=1 Tax=Nocardia puris TaxID=208602 RepID=UPI001894B35A|nr:DUF6221 family protein [Nocardia puris]MBF6213753.1 hypothetical protein [Nocardia puris]